MVSIMIHRKVKHMKKTDRKNNTNQVVTYPSCIFTTEELHNMNSHMKLITLRKRVTKEEKVTDIGYLHNNKGRPRTVYFYGTLTEAIIDEAKSKGIVLKSDLVVSVASITPTSKSESEDTVVSLKAESTTSKVVA